MERLIEYIAVAPESLFSGIKRQLLLFDKVAVVHDDRDWRFREKNPSLAADFDWLENNGLIFRVGEFLKKECGFEFVDRGHLKRIDIKVIDLPPHKAEEVREVHMGAEFALQFAGKTVRDFMLGLEDLNCRWEAERLRKLRNLEAISIFSPRAEVNRILGVKTGPGDVMRVLLKGIPEPSSEVSLEQIVRFRQDSGSKNKMVAFRKWARTMVAGKTSEKELVQELDWLTHEYSEYMRIHEMKVRKSAIEVFVTTAAEAAENLVKVRWGKLARLLFSVQHTRMELLELELKAPGREIAYVVEARKEFDK